MESIQSEEMKNEEKIKLKKEHRMGGTLAI